MSKERKKTKKTAVKKNSRIKQVGDTHWVLKSQNDVRKYKGFKSKSDAERFAATTPLEKGVKISAEKARSTSVKKSAKGNAAPKVKKAYAPPQAEVVGLDRQPPSGNDPKIQSFAAGREKYKKE